MLAPGLLVAQAMREARNVAKLRAYRDAREAVEFERGEDVSAGLVRTAERRATNQLEATAAAYPPPLATAALSEVAGRVRSVDLEFDASSAGERQRERVDAYVACLAGEHQLRNVEAILAPFEGETIDPDAFE